MKFIFICLIIIVIGVGVGLYKYNATGQPVTTPTVTVKRDTIVEKVTVVGNIVPNHTISVKSMLPGTVGHLFHAEGDYVEQGDLLLQVSPAPTPQNMAEAHTALKEEQAALKQASDYQKRYAQLIKSKIVTATDYANAVKNLAIAKARVEGAKQKLGLLQKGETTIAGHNIKTTIQSPISGFILQRNVDVGDPVVPLTESQPGTILFVIADMQDLIFKGLVNEIDVANIHPQMTAAISVAAIPDLKIKSHLSKLGLTSHQGTKEENKNNNTSPFNVGYSVELNKLELPKTIKLRAGYSATAEIIVKHIENALVIPERVLIFKDNNVYVNRFTEGTLPTLQQIKVGASDGINVEVLTGLKEGERVLDNLAASPS